MDTYRIKIRCQHITTHGTLRSPVVALATLVGGVDGEDSPHWAISAAHSDASVLESPTAKRARRSAMHRQDIAFADAAEIQSPANPAVSDFRYAIACAYPSCRQRITARWRKLEALLDEARRADIHTLRMSELRVKL
ncbi:hypothetical protein QE377_002976 [Microbacterium sp. SORGH_AS 862]|nr:hypothetical protein [Microbacterium sp. SORGH_AS_0862]